MFGAYISLHKYVTESNLTLMPFRIPFGYWSVPLTSDDTDESTDTSPYIPGAWPYLLRALNWARMHSIHVIVDIHGAPGSQNGYDNSGQRTGNPQWAYNESYVNRTLDTVKYIVENVGGMLDVMELVNEAAGFESDEFTANTKQYFQDGYDVVRDTVGQVLQVMIGDAFRGVTVSCLKFSCHEQKRWTMLIHLLSFGTAS